MTDDLATLVTFVTGAGGASAVMFMWIKSLKEQLVDLLGELKAERERNNKFAEALMELVTETKIHLEHAGSPESPIANLVIKQHDKTRVAINSLPNEISNLISS